MFELFDIPAPISGVPLCVAHKRVLKAAVCFFCLCAFMPAFHMLASAAVAVCACVRARFFGYSSSFCLFVEQMVIAVFFFLSL